jgi:hypothetical protein
MSRHVHLASLAAIIAIAVTTISIRTGAAQRGGEGLDISTPVTYFIASGNADSGFRPTDRQLAQWALESWQRHAGGRLQLEPAPEEAALVRVYWANGSGGQYGEMRPLRVGGRHGAAVTIRPDMEALGPDIAVLATRDPLLRDAIVYLTCLHELGHALGLSHTADFLDIMYSFGYGGDIVAYFNRYRAQIASRSEIAAVSGLSQGDIRRLRELYRAP